MGIRRRRRQLTTLMNRMDQRVRSVELRPISLLTQAQITALTTPTATDPTDTPSLTIVSPDAPDQWIRVDSAWFYAKKATGFKNDYVEVFFEKDIGVAVGDSLQVSGIHGTSTFDIEVSGTFKTTAVDTAPWTGRGAYAHTPASNVTNTYTYTPGTSAPTTWSTNKQLRGKQAIYSYSATGDTVTITFSIAHKFKAGDVISVDFNVEKPVLYGLDGIYKVDTVTSTTLTYKLSTALDVPINTKVLTDTLYIYPVAHKYVREGATWADSANNKTWYWDGLRWIDYSAVTDPVRDGDPPAAPTGFSGTSEGIVVGTNSALPLSKITLSWTAPTKTKAGKTLDDLVGYTISWRKNVNESWRSKVVKEQVTSYVFDGDASFEQNQTYLFKITAFDSGLQDSDPATTTLTTSVKATTLTSVGPSAPIVTSKLGVFTVRWDGNLATNPVTVPPSDTTVLQIHYSTTSNFTPSDSTLKASLQAVPGQVMVFAGLTYGVTYYFKFLLKDSSGAVSLPSAQATGQITPLVDADLIAAKLNAPLSEWPFAPKAVTAGALADGALNASSVFGANVITQQAISANAIGADQIAANAVTAGKINAGAVTASKIEALAISADKIAANAITAAKIDVGSVAAAVVTSTYVTADVISGSKTVSFTDGSNASNKVVLGYNDIASGNYSGVGATLYASNSNGPGGFVGYLGTWGTGDLELATHYLHSYLDLNRGDLNTTGGFNINMSTNGNITLTASDPVGSTSMGYINTSAKRLTHEGAVTINTGNTSGFRLTNPNNNTTYGFTWNSNAGTSGGTTVGRFFIDPGVTTSRGLEVQGTVAYYGTATNLSSRSLKFDISSLDLDIPTLESQLFSTDLVKFKYKQTDGTENPDVEYSYGVIAEDIEQAGLFTATKYHDGKLVGVDYTMFGLLLVPVVKRLREEIDLLKRELGK